MVLREVLTLSKRKLMTIAYFNVFRIILCLTFASSIYGQESALSQIMTAIKGQDFQDLKAFLIQHQDQLSIEDQKIIAKYATNFRDISDKNAWFSSDTKKEISAILCLLAFCVGGALAGKLVVQALFIMFFYDVSPNNHRSAPFIADVHEFRRFVKDPFTYLITLSAFSLLIAGLAVGYDNLTGYYSEKERFIQNFIYNNLPYFKKQLSANTYV